jgi:hypothetical protein
LKDINIVVEREGISPHEVGLTLLFREIFPVEYIFLIVLLFRRIKNLEAYPDRVGIAFRRKTVRDKGKESR